MQKITELMINIVNKIGTLTCRIKPTVRKAIIYSALILMMLQMFFYTSWEKYGINYGYAELLISNGALLFLVAILSIDRVLGKINLNKPLCALWFLFALLVILTGLHHNITPALMFFGLLCLTVFPFFYYVWNARGDVEVLFAWVARSILIAWAVLVLANMCMAPLSVGAAYFGVAVNSNSIGMTGLGAAIASMYLMCVSNRKILYAFTLATGVVFSYLSASRASVLAIIFAFVCLLICAIREKDKKALIAVALSVVFFFVVNFCVVFVLTNFTPRIVNYYVAKTPETTEAAPEAPEQEIQITVIQDDTLSALEQKMEKTESANSLSSGRLEIWKNYIKNLNLIGNERDNEGLYIPERGSTASAHNTYLEIAYRCGIVTGLMYLAIALYAAFYAFRFLFSKRYFLYSRCIIPMSVMAFGVMSNLERAIYPLEKIHIFLFFMCLIPMFVKDEKTEN